MQNRKWRKAVPAGTGFPRGNRIFHLFLLLFLLSGGLHGQEVPPGEGVSSGENGLPPGAASDAAGGSSSWGKGAELAEGEGRDREDQVYFIREISFNIIGRTKPFALFNRGEFKAGEEIRGEKNLIRYLAHKTQLLINQRALEEAIIEDRRGEAEEDGRIPVDLLITTRDTWNFIILPRPQLDNNEGFDLSLKIRDYNFLGSLSPLRIDIGYQLDNEYVDSGFFSNLDRGKFNFIIDSEIPFRALGLDWNINFDHIFGYTLGEPISYKNITGISVEYPYKTTTFTFGFEQNVSFYEENEDRFKSQYGKYFDGEYLSSELYAAWEIPLGYEVAEFGGLIYTPRISAGINYRPWGSLDYPRESPKTVSAINSALTR